MRITFRRKRLFLLVLGFVVFQCLYVLGLMYLGKSSNMFGSFTSVFGHSNRKSISVMMVHYANAENGNKYQLNLDGFIKASDNYPEFKVSVVEGVGNNLLILSDIINKAHERGVSNIFLFGFPYGLEMENIFRRYPNISFFYYNGKSMAGNVRNYGVSIFMEKYYLGMLAGMQTTTNNVGYISDFPVVEHERSLNYFARGVEYVNPEAKVHVVWTRNAFDINFVENAVAQLNEQNGVDVVTGSMNACFWCQKAEDLGVYFIGQHSDGIEKDYQYYISSYELNYQQVYKRLFSLIDSGFNGFAEGTTWFSEEDGAVTLASTSSRVSREAVRRIGFRRSQLLSCDDYVFRGPVYANNGQMIAPANSLITDKILSENNMFLYKNILEYVLDDIGNLAYHSSSKGSLSSEFMDGTSFYERDLRQQSFISLTVMKNKAECVKRLKKLSNH